MQSPPQEMMLQGIRELVQKDIEWIPAKKGTALYIRPTLIGTEGFLGVRPSRKYLFFVILSPVSAYYTEGLTPIRIWVEEKYVRAAPGGLGATKAGANYAASLLAALEAKKKGYAQVLWMDPTHQFVEEVGTMNVFFVMKGEVITPALNGSILAGGVRQSAITLLRDRGYKVTERKISIQEIMSAIADGSLSEAFGTGTAAVISPVGELFYGGKSHVINGGKMGEISQMLYDDFTAMQFGEKPDPHGWFETL
jgi:branched-chain amino acid aminotransferase